MHCKVAKMLCAAGLEMGQEYEIYEDYSGRGMYGKATTALTIDNKDSLLQAVAEAMLNFEFYKENTPEPKCDEENITPRDFVTSIGGIKFDSLGLKTVAY